VRIVFLGTPEFAVPSLAALAARFDVALVVAQPDRPKGRGRVSAAPPVKERAFALGLPCMQVEKPNAPGAVAALARVEADLFVVVAYGALLSPALLAVPRLGCINLHASLLPSYRGASPIQAAILDGRGETGNTTMWMAEGLDTGDVIRQRALPIGPDETAGELSARLAADGAPLLVETIEQVEAGTAPRTPQDDAAATVTKKIRKADGRLDFAQPATAVHDRARAMTPWPGAQAEFDGTSVRFERTRVVAAGEAVQGAQDVRPEPGGILGEGPQSGLVVACGTGAIEVLRVRPAGRKDMNALDWWRGLRSGQGSTPRFITPSRDEEKS
jgi:methionyl-tRNA formyltransferase